MRWLSLVAASGGHSSSRCAGLSPSRPLLLRSTGSRRAGSVIVAHGCSAACGIFPDQGSNPCPPHWQADSQPLCHQVSPRLVIFKLKSLRAFDKVCKCYWNVYRKLKVPVLTTLIYWIFNELFKVVRSFLSWGYRLHAPFRHLKYLRRKMNILNL